MSGSTLSSPGKSSWLDGMQGYGWSERMDNVLYLHEREGKEERRGEARRGEGKSLLGYATGMADRSHGQTSERARRLSGVKIQYINESVHQSRVKNTR